MLRRETSVWMMMWSSSISKPNQERKNWRRSFLFLAKYKTIFCALQIIRSRSRKRERITTEEKAPHPSWSSAITRIYGVAPKPFLVRPHCPPPFSPFPPLSPPIQCLPVLIRSWLKTSTLISLYRPGLWTKFRPKFASKMCTYVSHNFFLTTEFACTYVSMMYCEIFVRVILRVIQLIPKTPMMDLWWVLGMVLHYVAL